MEHGGKNISLHGFLLIIYGVFLFMSIRLWLDMLKGTGGESFGQICIGFPLLLASLFYVISGILIFKKAYFKAISFAIAGLVFCSISICWSIGFVDYYYPSVFNILILLVLYFVIPVLLSYLIFRIMQKEDKQRIAQNYFPPQPPATP